MLKIESGKKMPEERGCIAKYPWAEMEVGQSFFCECPDNRTRARQKALSTCGAHFAERHGNGYKFATRRVEGGVRVWRVK